MWTHSALPPLGDSPKVQSVSGKFTTLEKASLTQSWSLEERSALAHFLKSKSFREGESVFLSRSKDRGMFFIGSGLIQIQHETSVANLKDGDSFGELSLVFSSQKLITATSLKATETWFLSVDQWHDLRKVAPVVSLKLLESICQKFAGILNGAVPPPRVSLAANATARPSSERSENR